MGHVFPGLSLALSILFLPAHAQTWHTYYREPQRWSPGSIFQHRIDVSSIRHYKGMVYATLRGFTSNDRRGSGYPGGVIQVAIDCKNGRITNSYSDRDTVYIKTGSEWWTLDEVRDGRRGYIRPELERLLGTRQDRDASNSRLYEFVC